MYFILMKKKSIKQDIKKWLKKRYPLLSEEFEKKKGQKYFGLLERGFEPQIFSNFPDHDLNFHGK